MKLALVAITSAKRPARKQPAHLLADDYTARSARLAPFEALAYASESALFDAVARQTTRAPAQLCLFDPSGDSLTSIEFAHYIGRVRDGGTQRMILAIGPANGWSESALRRAHRVLSLGKMTLPHELARVVVAEQIYRALTILAGHPYHLGH